MSVSFFEKKVSVRSLAVVLASSLLVSLVVMPVASAQQMGPMPPRQPQQKENPMMKTLGKVFKQKKEEDDVAGGKDAKEGEASEDAGKDAKSADGKSKPKVTEPEEAEQPVKRTPVARPPMLNQPELTDAKIEPPQVDEANPPVIDHPKLDDPSNPLGLTDAANRLQKLIALVDQKRYAEAKPGLAQLRQWLVDLTEAHIGLYKVLNQLPSARGQAELEKELALQFAQLRDRTMMEMARVYISEREFPKAVKELTEVVKSQPRSKVGLRSYELLQEIGFTEKLQLTQ